MSGPAVLKLSAWGARELEQRGYSFAIQINWVGLPNENEVSEIIGSASAEARKKKLANACPFELPKNFWLYLLEKSGLDADSPWMELGKKGRNKLINTLLNDTYTVRGKTTFKEEFVTCGGVALGEVDFKTMQSRVVPGLYFAGEVLDVDGITGGFNFQAAWTTGFVAGQLSGPNSAYGFRSTTRLREERKSAPSKRITYNPAGMRMRGQHNGLFVADSALPEPLSTDVKQFHFSGSRQTLNPHLILCRIRNELNVEKSRLPDPHWSRQ